MTFKSKVEEILHDGCRFYEKDGKCAECDADLAAILAAYKEAVEGIDKLSVITIRTESGRVIEFPTGEFVLKEAYREHMLKEIGE